MVWCGKVTCIAYCDVFIVGGAGDNLSPGKEINEMNYSKYNQGNAVVV